MFKEIFPEDIPQFESVSKLVDEVEELSGLKVRYFLFKDEPLYERLDAGSSTDLGYPEILFAENALSTINACHELLHLRCDYLGYPRTEFTFEADVEDTDEAWWVQDSVTEIISINEHSVIYPQMEAMGFDPIKDGEGKYNDRYFDGLMKTKAAFHCGAIEQSGLSYLVTGTAKILLEVKDKDFRNKFFQEKSWFQSEFALGRKIAARIKKGGDSPNARRSALIDALNIARIPRDRYRIEMRERP